MWKEIEREKAKERQGQRNDLINNNIVDTSPTSLKSENGRSREIIANKVKIGSGRTYERAKIAAIEINRLKKENKEKED